MALHPSGFLNQDVELLRIETNLFDLYIQGKPFHPTVETLQFHRDDQEDLVDATFEIGYREYPIEVKLVKLFSPISGTLSELGEERVLPCFYENQSYQLVVQNTSDKKIEFHHENINLRQAVKPLGRNILTGVLNFHSEVGYTELCIRIEGQPALDIRLEIFPSKMDYKRDYQLILKDVNEQIYNLSFDFLRKTYQLTGLKETRHQSLTEFFTILRHVFDQLVSNVERLQMSPHHRLFPETKLVNADRVKRAGKENLSFLGKRPHLLVKDQEHGFLQIGTQQYRPTKLIETQRKIDFNTHENRFVKWVMERMEVKLKEIVSRVSTQERRPDPLLSKQIEQMRGHIKRLLRLDFLQNVGKMERMSITVVLQMAPGYRDIYRTYLLLMKGLSIQGELYRLSMKDVAQLYEYWCFLKIHSILRKKYELIKQDIIRVHRNGLFLTLDKSKKASVKYLNPRNGETFTLFYNALPSEDSREFPTLPQRPDNVLTLKKMESTFEYKYIFDSKYRLNPAYEGTSYYRDYGSPGPEEDDINTMHRYRDAIVYQDHQTEDFERSMFGAYVLFPYPDEEKYREHKFYRSIKKVNVGALPFLPNSTKLMEQFLDELILDSPEKAFERSIRPRGTSDYYKDKLGGKNVLIGSLGTRDQLETCLSHRFYYIPLQHLTKEQQLLSKVEFVGLYQSRRLFGEKESGIHWVGLVSSWTVIPRYLIKERPVRRGNVDELYVRFEIKEWVKRERPILPGGYGIYTHLFAVKYVFDRAMEIAELKLTTEENLKDWREKRRMGKVKVELDRENVDQADKVSIDLQ
ncbi:MAG TPA: restriction endonuclease-like protein [Bacillota bacterium]|nr:restriction endonuclease-like protein [Bacillota bacterium]